MKISDIKDPKLRNALLEALQEWGISPEDFESYNEQTQKAVLKRVKELMKRREQMEKQKKKQPKSKSIFDRFFEKVRKKREELKEKRQRKKKKEERKQKREEKKKKKKKEKEKKEQFSWEKQVEAQRREILEGDVWFVRDPILKAQLKRESAIGEDLLPKYPSAVDELFNKKRKDPLEEIRWL